MSPRPGNVIMIQASLVRGSLRRWHSPGEYGDESLKKKDESAVSGECIMPVVSSIIGSRASYTFVVAPATQIVYPSLDLAIKTTWVSGLNLCCSIMKSLSSYCPPFSNPEHFSLFLQVFLSFYKEIQFPFWVVFNYLCFLLSDPLIASETLKIKNFLYKNENENWYHT